LKKQTSQSVIDRMNALCEAALASPEGLKIETDSPREAMKLRQQIYSARLELRKRNPSDTSAVCSVELKLSASQLLILKPGALLNQFKITDISSNEEVKISSPKSFSEEEIFDMMLKIASLRGPGDYEAEAKQLLLLGKEPEDA
jgi:hypothetical protein